MMETNKNILKNMRSGKRSFYRFQRTKEQWDISEDCKQKIHAILHMLAATKETPKKVL